MVYLYVMVRVTHLSVTMPTHVSFSNLSGYHLAIMLQNETMYKRYRHAGLTEKVISLLGKKKTGKKTPKEDSELGYSDFTLALTFHLPHPQQKKHAIVPNA